MHNDDEPWSEYLGRNWWALVAMVYFSGVWLAHAIHSL